MTPLTSYFRNDRKERWQERRLLRLHRWDRHNFDEPHPVPGLQRLINQDVRRFATSYYCLVSHCYSETMPPEHPNIPYDGLTYYQVEVFTYLGNKSPDPCIARVHCLTVRGLRKRVNEALTALEGVDLWGLAPVNQGWCNNLEDLILHECTSPAMRVEVFRRLVRKLTANEATDLTNLLLADIKSRQPGQPGYAAMMGLHTDGQA